MILKYNINIDNNIIIQRFRTFVNQTYKLLPIREQGSDWQKPLQTLIEELVGMYNLLQCGDDNKNTFLILFNKLEGLYSLVDDKDFFCYRRTIFECINLVNVIKDNLCLQNYQKKE